MLQLLLGLIGEILPSSQVRGQVDPEGVAGCEDDDVARPDAHVAGKLAVAVAPWQLRSMARLGGLSRTTAQRQESPCPCPPGDGVAGLGPHASPWSPRAARCRTAGWRAGLGGGAGHGRGTPRSFPTVWPDGVVSRARSCLDPSRDLGNTSQRIRACNPETNVSVNELSQRPGRAGGVEGCGRSSLTSSSGEPTGAYAAVDDRDRELVERGGLEKTIKASPPGCRSANLLATG